MCCFNSLKTKNWEKHCVVEILEGKVTFSSKTSKSLCMWKISRYLLRMETFSTKRVLEKKNTVISALFYKFLFQKGLERDRHKGSLPIKSLLINFLHTMRWLINSLNFSIVPWLCLFHFKVWSIQTTKKSASLLKKSLKHQVNYIKPDATWTSFLHTKHKTTPKNSS